MRSPFEVKKIFRGWYVVGAAFVVTFIGFGIAYTFSAFIAPLEAEFGASRGSVSLVFSLAGFLYFALGALSGPLADRWGACPLAAVGMLFIGAGLLLASQARTLTEVYWAYALGVGLGVGCAYVPALGAVQRWFERRRATASGLAVMGVGVGTLVMPALAVSLIAASGWREAYIWIGGIALVVGLPATLLLENDPRRRGLLPDGVLGQLDVSPRASAGSSVREATHSRAFWILYASTLLCSFGAFVPFVHLVPYATQQGIAAPSAALLVGTLGVGSTVGRFLLGSLADRMGHTRALAMMLAGMGGSLILWSVGTDFWVLVLFALLYGAFSGGWVAVMPSVVMNQFGGRNVGAIIGLLYTSVAFGTLAGPSAAGWAFDMSGTYTLPIVGAIGADFVGALLVWVAFASRRIPTEG
ncbi:MAG TPA: MFS transporter [Steroidobacteraceae bacterium]|nr:MFS transporter [Steroidobacteraceae bacterium]